MRPKQLVHGAAADDEPPHLVLEAGSHSDPDPDSDPDPVGGGSDAATAPGDRHPHDYKDHHHDGD
jgi:hypothetical protein